MRRILLCLSHSIEEFDQLSLLSSLGYEVASIGGYINPHAPHDPKRPALPGVPRFPEVQEAVDAIGSIDNLGRAQSHIPDAIIDWLGDDGVVIFHHQLGRLFGQWDHLAGFRRRGGRTVWRTVGQSVENNESEAAPFVLDGLEIVRYSPNERHIPGYVGEDAVIRFYKDSGEWSGWWGEPTHGDPFVANVTQDMVGRDPWTNSRFYETATRGLPTMPCGPKSEALPGGLGEIPYGRMKEILRGARCYMYTGTQPASYTLGLLEALMTGTPVVSIGPAHMQIFPYGPKLFEGHELSPYWSNDPLEARATLENLLVDKELASLISIAQRRQAVATFGSEKVGADWRRFLDAR